MPGRPISWDDSITQNPDLAANIPTPALPPILSTFAPLFTYASLISLVIPRSTVSLQPTDGRPKTGKTLTRWRCPATTVW